MNINFILLLMEGCVLLARLPYVKFTEDKVLVVIILRKKCEEKCNCNANPNPNPNFQSRLIR